MLSDPLFYLVSIPAVLLYGIAKGGFGGPVSVLAVPLMALVMTPVQAAAILLPILVVMDGFALRAYWGVFDRKALWILLPGALLGVAIGFATAEQTSDDVMRVMIGAISLIFGIHTLARFSAAASAQHHVLSGTVWGGLAGFTSFSIHAGGPPLAVYLLPKRLSPLLFAGTTCVFFAVVNVVKLFPYYLLDQLRVDNLLLSLVLVPLAPLGVFFGHWLVKRTEARWYYRIVAFFLIVLGGRLLWDGLAGMDLI